MVIRYNYQRIFYRRYSILLGSQKVRFRDFTNRDSSAPCGYMYNFNVWLGGSRPSARGGGGAPGAAARGGGGGGGGGAGGGGGGGG